MAQSEYTKITRIKLWLCRILDWLFLFAPAIVYTGIAFFSDGVAATAKAALSATVVIALIFTILNIFRQKKFKCPIWIVLIGLYVAFQKWLLPLVVMLAIASLLDDIMFSPLIQHYKMKLEANKVMDERLN